MKEFANVNPASLDHALTLLSDARADGRRAVVAGGGSDLLGMIKGQLGSPDLLINLKSIAGLDRITAHAEHVAIGGLTTLDRLARDPLVRARCAVLAEAADSVATPQIRNVGTLAGNLCQRPWCWYFRNGFPC